jgi:oligopeptide transport system substrate-binding protein
MRKTARPGCWPTPASRCRLSTKPCYSLEKETIPYWSKFLQGYYDSSGISSDSFDQAVQFTSGGDPQLTDSMREQDIHLITAVAASLWYVGFNMLDPVVGGLGEDRQKLRQALSIAFDYDEFISIFLNGRGIPAQGPIPPGLFGHVEGVAGLNPYVYEARDGQIQRRPSKRRGSCWPRRATRTGATRRRASRWCCISTPWRAAPTPSRGSTG